MIDLEIVAGTKQEKERSQAAVNMMDPGRYPVEALEHMQKIMLAILSQKTHPAETDQKEPQREYIK